MWSMTLFDKMSVSPVLLSQNQIESLERILIQKQKIVNGICTNITWKKTISIWILKQWMMMMICTRCANFL